MNPISPLTHTLGYPRIGEKRELKKATEAYWAGKLSLAELEETGRTLRRQNWLTQQAAGIDLIPSNDFSFYDQMLDLTCLVGNVPPRFGWAGGQVDLDTRFAIARGVARVVPAFAKATAGGPNALAPTALVSESTQTHTASCGCATCQPAAATFASEMTKWFDTNYHFIVPEFQAATAFKLSATKIFDEFSEALALGLKTKPVLIGPVTYLKLGKVQDPANSSFDRFELLPRLLPVYIEILQKLAALGAEWVQLDEPIFALDLTTEERAALTQAYATLAAAAPQLKVIVAAYFGGLRDNLDCFLSLPVTALHFDLTRDPAAFELVARVVSAFAKATAERPDVRRSLGEGGPNALNARSQPKPPLLSLGLIDARNIWRIDFAAILPLLKEAIAAFGPERLLIAPSCSLQHVPVTLRNEAKLDAELKGWLAYAEEKLAEVVTLRDLAIGIAHPQAAAANHAAAASRRSSPRIHRPAVKERAKQVAAEHLSRSSAFPERQVQQRKRLGLPLFPTTTIGSFPQTPAVRAARAKWKKGELNDADYEKFLEAETLACVRYQEEIGLDMLVHGEYERNDMVEYFGEQLEGFAFTENGWVQSYGSRYVKPPIIYGDVARPKPMTVRWSAFAQSLTSRPMKGMLTGPVTVLRAQRSAAQRHHVPNCSGPARRSPRPGSGWHCRHSDRRAGDSRGSAAAPGRLAALLGLGGQRVPPQRGWSAGRHPNPHPHVLFGV